jgi:hypothetical protein
MDTNRREIKRVNSHRAGKIAEVRINCHTHLCTAVETQFLFVSIRVHSRLIPYLRQSAACLAVAFVVLDSRLLFGEGGFICG